MNFKTKKLCIILIIILSINCFSCVKYEYKYDSSILLNDLYTANDSTFAEGVAEKIIIPKVLEELTVNNVSADCYFVSSTNRFESDFAKYHNAHKKVPMASLTKLMTALVTLQNCKNLDDEYYVSSDAVDLDKDVSKANLQVGDKVKIRDLLYGLLLPSGNDAANCLAENVASSKDNFVIMMNNEARRLGALHTHFANPHGLDSEFHFSTAYDLFLITRELAKYELFRSISVADTYTADIIKSDGTLRKEKWITTNFFVTKEFMLSNNVELLGCKTGNTKNAGYCLVLLCKDKKTGVEYISVVLNAKTKSNSYYNSNALLTSIPK